MITLVTKNGMQAEIIKLLSEERYMTFSDFMRCFGSTGDDRMLDRALQGLRKAGKIIYINPPLGWCLKSRAPAWAK
jgi:hypothetical protein